MTNKLLVKRLTLNSRVPTKTYPDEDAGYDIYSIETVEIPPKEFRFVSTGIAVAPPSGWYLQLLPRSSYGKNGLRIHPGVCDNGYRGEISAIVFNLSETPYRILEGDKIAQFVLLPILQNVEIDVVDHLPPSKRDTSCFGSSGR